MTNVSIDYQIVKNNTDQTNYCFQPVMYPEKVYKSSMCPRMTCLLWLRPMLTRKIRKCIAPSCWMINDGTYNEAKKVFDEKFKKNEKLHFQKIQQTNQKTHKNIVLKTRWGLKRGRSTRRARFFNASWAWEIILCTGWVRQGSSLSQELSLCPGCWYNIYK